MPRLKRYSQDEMLRRRRYKVAFVRQHIDKFIEADVYAEEHRITLGYEWQGHMRELPAIEFLLTELRKVVHYYPSLNGQGRELRIDIWHSLYGVAWRKRIRPTLKDYDYLVHRAKQKKISAKSDPLSMLFP